MLGAKIAPFLFAMLNGASCKIVPKRLFSVFMQKNVMTS